LSDQAGIIAKDKVTIPRTVIAPIPKLPSCARVTPTDETIDANLHL
jgi:hypothetical protein